MSAPPYDFYQPHPPHDDVSTYDHPPTRPSGGPSAHAPYNSNQPSYIHPYSTSNSHSYPHPIQHHQHTSHHPSHQPPPSSVQDDTSFLSLLSAAASQHPTIPGSYHLSAGSQPTLSSIVPLSSSSNEHHHPHSRSASQSSSHASLPPSNPYPPPHLQRQQPQLIVSTKTQQLASTSAPSNDTVEPGVLALPIKDDLSLKKRKAGESVADKKKAPNAKVPLSCAECRRLKLKCDRVFPCGNCKKRGVATICPEGELKGGKGKRLILASTEDLHARISALEGALRELTKNTPEGTHPLLESSFHYEPLDTDDKSVKSLSARTKSTKGQKRLDEDDSEVEIVQPGTKGKDKARDVDGPSNQETHGGNDSGNSSSREKGEGREVKVKLEGIGKNMVLDDNDDDAGANIMAKAPLSDIAPVEASFGQLTMGDEPGHSRYFGSGSASAYLLASPTPRSSSQSPGATSYRSNPTSPLANLSSPISSDPLLSGESPSPGTNTDLQFGISPDVNPKGFTDSFPFEGAPPSSRGHTGGLSAEMLQSHLPPREKAFALADTYFRNGSWMYNIVPRSCFDSRYFLHVYPHPSNVYNPLYPPRSQPSTQQLAVVYMVLALGALFDLSLPPYNDLAARYYALGRAALACNSSGSVAFVVAVSLMGTYLLNGSKAVAGGESFWPILGLAVRTAQAIGLHRDGQNWGLETVEVDERRRCLWEIYSYDVLQSTSQGRPRLMHERNIDAQLPGTGSEERLKAQPTYHQELYKLIKLIAKINDLQCQVTPVAYDAVLSIDREIRAFERSLPPELHCSEESCVLPTDNGGVDGRTLVLQRHSMLIIISQSLLFLHRGWFARALRDYPDEPLRSKSSQSYVAELEACKTILSVIRDLMKLQGPLASRWWFFWFQAFSACVCLAAVCIRAPSSSLALSALQELELGVSLFEAAKIGSRAREELPMLVRLRDRAKERIKAHLPSSATSQKPTLVQCTDDICQKEDLELMGAETSLKRMGSDPHCSTSPIRVNREEIVMSQPSSHLPPSSFQLSSSSSMQQSMNASEDPFHDSSSLQQQRAQHQQQSQQRVFHQSQQHQHAPPQPNGYLPKTLDEAVAAQPLFSPSTSDSFFSDPNFWSVNGGGTNPLSSGSGSAGQGTGGGLFGFSPPDVLASGGAGNGGMSRDGMSRPNPVDLEFNFDEFIAGIGLPPTEQLDVSMSQYTHPGGKT